LSRKHHVDFPISSEERWSGFFCNGGLDAFVVAFTALFDLVKDGEDFERVGREVFEDLAADGIGYAEPRLTITSHLSRGVSLDKLVEGLSAAAEYAKIDLGLEIRWIIDFPRILGPKVAEQALEEAIAGKVWGVAGFDISGYESRLPDGSVLEKVFARAREHGLRTTAHAGEVGSSENIRTALCDWKVDRIGHGTRLVESPSLMKEVLESGVPIEVCPTSNVRLGAIRSLADHPLETFRSAGIPIVVNTDDPSLFGTTLSREMCDVARAFGWTEDILGEIIQNGWKYRFSGNQV
jgi:aminodeoxyfutalosine deaminase